MKVRHPRQTGIPLSRYVVMIVKTNQRTRRTSAVTIGSTDSPSRARTVLDQAAAAGYTGWIEDRDTGRRWNRDAGWFNP